MNKADLVEALAVHFDGNKAEAGRALAAVLDTMSQALAAGEKVSLTGFGVFEPQQRPERTVRNPRTGERKQAPATTVPRFRAGSELKAAVAGQAAAGKATKGAAAKGAASKAAAAAEPAKPAKRAAKKTATKSTAATPAAATKPGAAEAAAPKAKRTAKAATKPARKA